MPGKPNLSTIEVPAFVFEDRVFALGESDDFRKQFEVDVGGERSVFQTASPKLLESLAHANLLANSTFEDGPKFWVLSSAAEAQGAVFSTNFSRDTTLAGYSTAYVSGPSDAKPFLLEYIDPVFGTGIPIKEGAKYAFSGLIACHRCVVQVELTYVGSSGEEIETFSERIAVERRGGQQESDYHRFAVVGIAPITSNATRLSIRLVSTSEVEGTAFFFFLSKPQFGLYHEGELTQHRGYSDIARAALMHSSSHPNRQIYEAIIDVESLNTRQCSVKVVSAGDLIADDGTVIYDSRSVISANHVSLTTDGRLIRINRTGHEALVLFMDGLRVAGRFSSDDFPTSIAVTIEHQYLDGRAHLIEVRDHAGASRLARGYFQLPYVSTPWTALQEHSRPRPPSHLAPNARYRLKALEDHILNGSKAVTSQAGGCQFAHALRVVSNGFEGLTAYPPISFEIVEDPLVSIVIPVHNKINVTYFCLCSLLIAFNKASFEVIVVDDGSQDSTRNLESIVGNITVVRNKEPLGFVRACNRGVAAARGQYIGLLNNDTEPSAGWIDALLAAFEAYDGVGLAGSKLIYPDGTLQEAGGIVWGNGNPWNYGRSSNADDPRFCYSRQVDYLSGAAMMLPAAVWKEVGGFSDEFAPAYFEDTDLAFKVRQAGYKTIYASSSVVVHFEGVTSGTSVTSGAKRFQELNRPKFKQKWAGAYRTGGKEGSFPDLEKDRGILGRVLFVDYQTPKIDTDAGSYAAFQEMRLVQGLGYKVSFFPINAAHIGRHTDYLQAHGVECLYAPFVNSVEEILRARGNEFDAIYITRYYVAQQCIELIRKYAPNAKILLCNADLHFLRELRRAVVSGDEKEMAHALQVREEELSVMRRVDVTLSYNVVEHAVILSHNLTSGRVVKAPWVQKVRDGKVPFEDRSGIVFLGGFNHPPNLEAVQFFAREVMPLLRRTALGHPFMIYGSNVHRTVADLAADDILVNGYVEDVSEAFDRGAVFVAPLRTGAGIKGKVLSSLAHGIPSVLSEIAAEGIGLRDGQECLIVDSASEWADAILRVTQDQALWTRLSSNGREFIRQHYSYEIGLATMKRAFQTVDLYS